MRFAGFSNLEQLFTVLGQRFGIVAKNGSKNYFHTVVTPGSSNGASWTYDKETGIITINGTATDSFDIPITVDGGYWDSRFTSDLKFVAESPSGYDLRNDKITGSLYVANKETGAPISLTSVSLLMVGATNPIHKKDEITTLLADPPSTAYFASVGLVWQFSAGTYNNDTFTFMACDPNDSGEFVPPARTNKELTNALSVTKFTVDITNWSTDTAAQSGSTFYKKALPLNHVYVDSPKVDIAVGTNNTLPLKIQQTAYDLLQYVTIDPVRLKLYLYASAIPTDTFYINVEGVD